MSLTYKNGPLGMMLASERNSVETRVWSIAGYGPWPCPD
jgi:hypothetical protein